MKLKKILKAVSLTSPVVATSAAAVSCSTNQFDNVTPYQSLSVTKTNQQDLINAFSKKLGTFDAQEFNDEASWQAETQKLVDKNISHDQIQPVMWYELVLAILNHNTLSDSQTLTFNNLTTHDKIDVDTKTHLAKTIAGYSFTISISDKTTNATTTKNYTSATIIEQADSTNSIKQWAYQITDSNNNDSFTNIIYITSKLTLKIK